MSDRNIPSYIYKNRDKWSIRKNINGVPKHFKTFNTLREAIFYRNYLINHDWVEPKLSPQEELEKHQKSYYVRINLDSTHKWFRIKHTNGRYIGKTKSIYEALYYRDLYSTTKGKVEDIPPLKECDLTTNNPYLENGLKYPIPKRLELDKSSGRKGQGKIVKKSVSCYSIYYGRKHVCTCRTYEQAYYVRRELRKCNWNMDELNRIFEDYPLFYTELLYYYIYIGFDKTTNSWLLSIPKDKSDDGKIQHIRYSKVEDALFERDFLMEHNWDYELLVECIDDSKNPYYNELLPYPERKIRHITPRKSHDEDFLKLAEILKENPKISMEKLSHHINITGTTLRNWFKQYNTCFNEFRDMVLDGLNPLDYIEQEKLIYQPDLSKSLPNNFKNNIHYKPNRKSKYIVSRKEIYYGAYATEELANKVVDELIKVDWDKSKLKDIKKKLNIYNWTDEYMYIYKTHPNVHSWQIRKKTNGKNKGYGVYRDIELAVLIRDFLVCIDFKCEDLDKLRQFGEFILWNKRLYYSNMFGGVRE